MRVPSPDMKARLSLFEKLAWVQMEGISCRDLLFLQPTYILKDLKIETFHRKLLPKEALLAIVDLEVRNGLAKATQ